MSKPFMCKIGLHSYFSDYIGTNVGTKDKPFVIFDRWLQCDKCPHRVRA